MVVTKTAIYLSWPSKAASWWLIHARHANSRKELIEEAGQAKARVPLQSQVPPAITQAGLCLQADATYAGYLTLSVICTFRYVGHSCRSPTNSRFFNWTLCFQHMSAKVCTCISTQTDKHCMMMDRSFFLLLLLLSQVLLIERLCVMSSVGKVPVETCERQGKIHIVFYDLKSLFPDLFFFIFPFWCST